MTYTTNSTSGVYSPPTLTVEKLMDIQRSLRALPQIPEIRESDLAVRRVQTRVYARRRAKSAAHHERMNKKWRKRFGETVTPTILEITIPGLAWGTLDRKVIYIHPVLAENIKDQFTRVANQRFNDYLGGIPWFSDSISR